MMGKKRKLGMGPMEERWRDGEVTVETWFERDRAFVGIQDVKTTDYLAEWWDEEVGEMVEDGFFEPHDELSVIKYADEIGIPAKKRKKRKKRSRLPAWRRARR